MQGGEREKQRQYVGPSMRLCMCKDNAILQAASVAFKFPRVLYTYIHTSTYVYNKSGLKKEGTSMDILQLYIYIRANVAINCVYKYTLYFDLHTYMLK